MEPNTYALALGTQCLSFAPLWQCWTRAMLQLQPSAGALEQVEPKNWALYRADYWLWEWKHAKVFAFSSLKFWKSRNKSENLIKFEKCSKAAPRKYSRMRRRALKQIKKGSNNAAPKCSMECQSRPKKVALHSAPGTWFRLQVPLLLQSECQALLQL